MNVMEYAVVDLDDAIMSTGHRPFMVLVGYRLFDVLQHSGRIGLRDGAFGFTHFCLDDDITIAIDRSLGEFEFRISGFR
jgi:hypothetical protein